ncbi:MAG: hypothetical protein AAGF83_06225 [Cyanobacteria bacterium P01_G01_bin.67]
MLDSFKLNLVWIIIEQAQTFITPELSDLEIVQYILDQIKAQIFLSTAETSETHSYIESRIPLIRDLAEIQHINRGLKEKIC